MGNRNLGFILMTAIASFALAGTGRADSFPTYSRIFSTRINFGQRIEIPYVLDSGDLDGDGFDDLAIGAKVARARGTDMESAPQIYSYVVRNLPEKRAFAAYSLGDTSLTHRTWAGAIARSGGHGFLVLGRNGESGLPSALRGEPITTYRIDKSGDGWAISVVYVSKERNTTASLSVCDIRHNGAQETYLNNTLSPFAQGAPERNAARMYQLSGGSFRATDPRSYMSGMQRGDVTVHNSVVFKDINGDGKCDLLAAYEGLVPEHKGGPMTGATGHAFAASDLAKFQSYVSLNSGGSFKGPMLLPNPPFGRNTSSFGIGGTKTNDGAVIVALTSSYFPSHQEGFSKFALQIFQLQGNRFVDVTSTRLSGGVSMKEATQAFIRFADIDGDGDEDFYLTRYDARITVFVQDEAGKFKAKSISGGGSGKKGVAFLKAAGKACMDMAVIHQDGVLSRFNCS